MFVLDTDHITLLEWGSGPVGQRLHERIRALPEDEVVTTVITYEEQTRGWMAYAARAKTTAVPFFCFLAAPGNSKFPPSPCPSVPPSFFSLPAQKLPHNKSKLTVS
jgi:hypothetical protein